MQFSIEIDDQDRDQVPELPWTAAVYPGDRDAVGSGVGATPAEAVRDALDQVDWEEVTGGA